MSVLDKIKNPNDVKKLNDKELSKLCCDIRSFLVNSVSKTGGHLASNLGVVELTVALCSEFDFPKDKIIWDVGHQSYVYKLLCGRKEEFKNLRSLNGMSGFTDPRESEYEFSVSGHSSTSLSTAFGLANARDILKENYFITAVIGDGALTGGLSFEALNSIGHSGKKMLIVLNDNDMSISKNVGGLSSYLSRVRTSFRYTKSKNNIEAFLKKSKTGSKFASYLRHIKENVKYLLSSGIWFEEMGLTYLGPVDGHDIKKMRELIKRASALDEPVILHIRTKKGKGYKFAEKNPEKYHGVSPFDENTGITKSSNETFSDVFGKKLCEIASNNEKVVAITPSMTLGSGLLEFEKSFPDRFFDVGIAEGHAVTFASGLAIGGSVPVVSVYSSFLQRAYDNVIEDIAILNSHVVFALDRAGFVPFDGPTHQGLFDLSYLSHIPNMTILSPSSFCELSKMLDYAVNKHNGPIALRYPRGREKIPIDNKEFVLGKASVVKEGSSVTLISVGSSVASALSICEKLENDGISSEVIDLRTVKPIDRKTIIKSANKTKLSVSIEHNIRRGGVGEAIESIFLEENIHKKLIVKAVDDIFVSHASENDLLKECGLDDESIIQAIKEELK